MLPLLFLTLLGLTASSSHNQVLNLPGPANKENYVSFNPELPALSALTVCAWQQKSYSDNKRYWFSYAVSGSDNEIIIGENGSGRYVFYLGSEDMSSDVGVPENQWTHVCMAWDSESGNATISVDGELSAVQKNFKKGGSVKAGGNLVIGQEQDSVGGKFDANQAYLGRLYKVNVWDYALNSTEISYLYESGMCGYGTAEIDPVVSYADILAQDFSGAASVIEGSCIDLADPSHGQVLRFPPQSKASTANYLQFTPDFDGEELGEFSVCSWYFKTFADKSRYFLSYAQSGSDNSIILGEDSAGKLGMWVSNKKLVSEVKLEQLRWYHLCFTWSGDNSSAIYVDGERVKEGAIAVGDTKTGGGIMNIGQEQDSVGGKYDASQAFAGSLYNFNMFSVQLSESDVARIYANGSFCEMIPDGMWEAGLVLIAYKDIYALIPNGDVVFDSGEAAWRHGAMHCHGGDLDEDAHKPDCWITEEKTRYKDEGNLGYIVGDVDAAKAACYAYGKCKTLTCYKKKGELRCDMKATYEVAKSDKKKTSYTYRC